MSTVFDLKEGEEFTFEVSGKTYRFSRCQNISERGMFYGKAIECILKTEDDTLVHILIVSDSDTAAVTGIAKGNYIAETIDEQHANELKKYLGG